MRRAMLFLLLAASPGAVLAREAVDASPPSALSVTVYRDPYRSPESKLDRNWPRGFAMVTETRQVTLPAGESMIRFEGVSEGMVAVSAIVTGLPGGTIEKNRNANLLSPGALVDGTLGNRVTVTRTNPGTGAQVSEDAIVRTRADGGLVLQTADGYEAVRCAGLPVNIAFDRVPPGLSAKPVYSVDTQTPTGGTYTVTLTYISWGFDWQANYVATLDDAFAAGAGGNDLSMHLTSWLTLVNDNGQSFPNAELLAVAGKLKVTSNYQQLASPPRARRLELVCYPIGSTAEGTEEELPPPPVGMYAPPPPPPAPVALAPQEVVVTGARMRAPAMIARQEDLADLKLYRVPEPVTVAAKSQKQVAFLDREGVKGRFLYQSSCGPWLGPEGSARPASILLATVNDADHGLGVALPTGPLTVFEPSPRGEQLVGRPTLRDYASGQDVEIGMGESSQVFATCTLATLDELGEERVRASMRATLTNATAGPVTVRLVVGNAGVGTISGLGEVRIKDGAQIVELALPANGRRELRWTYTDR
jgi:hypothetical protein